MIVLIVAVRVPHAHACEAGYRTYLTSSYLFELTVVPPHPSLFVYAGWDVSPALLDVTTLDGASVSFARVPMLEPRWTRVDLDVDSGFLVVRVPTTDRYWFFLIDPSFHPTTRAVEVDDKAGLKIESDAAAIRCESSLLTEVIERPFYRHRALDCERAFAFYSDGREELLFVRADYERRCLWRTRWRLLALTLAALVAFRRRSIRVPISLL